MVALAHRKTYFEQAEAALPAKLRFSFRCIVGHMRNDVARPVLECSRTRDALQVIAAKQGAVGIGFQRIQDVLREAKDGSKDYVENLVFNNELAMAELIERADAVWGHETALKLRRIATLNKLLVRMFRDSVAEIERTGILPEPPPKTWQRTQERGLFVITIMLCLMFAGEGDLPQGRLSVCRALVRHMLDAMEQQVFDVSALFRTASPPAPAAFYETCGRIADDLAQRAPGVDPVASLFDARAEERLRAE